MLRDTWSDIQSIIRDAPQYSGFIASVLRDPALPLVIDQVDRIQKAEAKKNPAAGPIVTNADGTQSSTPGIGLIKVVPLLQAIATAKEKPWIAPMVIGVVVALPIGLGVLIGRRFGRRR